MRRYSKICLATLIVAVYWSGTFRVSESGNHPVALAQCTIQGC